MADADLPNLAVLTAGQSPLTTEI